MGGRGAYPAQYRRVNRRNGTRLLPSMQTILKPGDICFNDNYRCVVPESIRQPGGIEPTRECIIALTLRNREAYQT